MLGPGFALLGRKLAATTQACRPGRQALCDAIRYAERSIKPKRTSNLIARALAGAAPKTSQREVNVPSNDYYDGLSNHYHMFQQNWNDLVAKEREAFKQYFEKENVKKVLDASCGSGEQAMALAGLDLQVTACDPSGGLVKRCAENAKKFGFEKQVRAQQSDFLNLNKDFKDELGTFDAVITKGSSLPHLLTDRDLLHALKNFHALLRPGGVVNIGVRDYDYFINSKAKLYPRQVRVGKDFKEEHLIFDVWEWHKGAEGQQLVDFNTFHINGKGDQHEASKFVTTFRALFRHEMEALLEEAGFVDIKVGKIHDWLWENVYTARRPVDADPPNTRPRERRAAASSEMHADPDPATNFPWRDCDFDQQGKGK